MGVCGDPWKHDNFSVKVRHHVFWMKKAAKEKVEKNAKRQFSVQMILPFRNLYKSFAKCEN